MRIDLLRLYDYLLRTMFASTPNALPKLFGELISIGFVVYGMWSRGSFLQSNRHSSSFSYHPASDFYISISVILLTRHQTCLPNNRQKTHPRHPRVVLNPTITAMATPSSPARSPSPVTLQTLTPVAHLLCQTSLLELPCLQLGPRGHLGDHSDLRLQ